MATTRGGADDGELGRAFRAGDAGATEGLFVRFGQPIHDFAARLVGDASAAEDVTQSTFLRAIERRSALRQPERIKAWLFSIAYNLARDELKRRSGERAAVGAQVAADGPDPEDVAVRHDDERLVWTAMGSLEPRQQAALDLAVRHGLSTGELGGVLGLSTAQASLVLFRARSALGTAIRSLLVAQSRTHCNQLAAMVPPGVAQLTLWQRRSVEHHMRHCTVCRERAAVLTAPTELLGGIALLPLPVSLGRGWLQRLHQQAASASGTVARVAARTALPRLALIGGGAALLLFGGSIGGVVIIAHGSHGAPHPRHPAAVASAAVATSSPTMLMTAESTPAPTEAAESRWADAQHMVQSASGYHVHYGSQAVASSSSPSGAPAIFDLTVQPNGDYQGTYTAMDSYIGQFDLRRVGGVMAVRNLDLVGNFGIAGAPIDARQFFALTGPQADALGDTWFPLTAEAQRPAAATITAALTPYVPAAQLAGVGLAPPSSPPLTLAASGDPSVVVVQAGEMTLSYQAGPGGYVSLSTTAFLLRVDHLGGT